MEHFHVYRDGQYDRRENIKIKLNDKIDLVKTIAATKLEEIDYYFVHHKKMVR